MLNLFLIYTSLFMCTRVADGLEYDDLRLVDGSHSREGRLEIYHSGVWGSVCDDNFGYPDASVACRQLGFRCLSEIQIYTQGGSAPIIWMDDVACNGLETSLKKCLHKGWASHNCVSHENVGIRCFGGCEGDLWLVGGSDNGRLNIYHSGSWGTICNDHFGSIDALVVCKQLKMRTTNVQFYTAANGHGTIWLDDVACNGQENRLDYCNHNGWSVHNCGHNKDVGVRCYGSYSSLEGDLRLVRGNNPEEGRLEIFHNFQWGTICDDGFGTTDAVVVCRQLGYRTSTPTVYTAGGRTVRTWLHNVTCIGTERRIADCSHLGWGSNYCLHLEDVGVRCTGEYGVNGNWGYWSAWSDCNSSCGSGTQTRTRRCDTPLPAFGGSLCTGDSHDSQTCIGSSCQINGNWGSWSDWTICSSSCDSGYQTRSRLCNNPVPSSNGAYCNGKTFEVLNCSIATCTVNGNWGSWSGWTVCSSSCDSGYQTRSRLCNDPVPSLNGAYCTGKSFEVLNCSIATCTVNGNWGSWSDWTICSSSCDSGHQTRSRLCNNPVPSSNGGYCNVKAFEVINCSLTKFKGNWGSWSDWTICSSSCDSGHQTRSRLCNDPVPTSNGTYCNGKSFEVLNCSVARCTVDGSWGGWGQWLECNATCDGGVQKRTRICNNPYPSAGGSACSGMAEQILICADINCPIIGAWSEWGVWSSCSTSCGSGNRTRSRLCDNPPPSYGGEYCNGNILDSDTCNTHECPIDGKWSEWSSWDTCSATCNGGIQDRNRECDAPLPSNGGRYCNGSTIESRSCNNENCEIDGQWSTWQEWQPCNTTCGNGSKHRIRECDSPSPYLGGSECMGLDFDIQTCYQDMCQDAHLQVKKETSNTVSSALLGGVAVACIVVTVVIMCIASFVFRRFRPGKVAKRKKSGCNTESLAELRVTSQQNDYDCIGRASGVQSGVYDTCRNANSIVYTNTQFTADTIETGVRANASCNADNIESDDHANIPCNADNIEGRAHANMPCNANKVEEIYENLKIR